MGFSEKLCHSEQSSLEVTWIFQVDIWAKEYSKGGTAKSTPAVVTV